MNYSWIGSGSDLFVKQCFNMGHGIKSLLNTSVNHSWVAYTDPRRITCARTPDDDIEPWARDKFPAIAEQYSFLAGEKAAAEGMSPKEAATVNSFEMSANLFCETVAEQGGQPVYNYRFGPEIPGDDAGAFHSSDLWFEFETLAKCWRPFKGKHYDLARPMCNYWTNFARNGNPNGLDADGTPMPQWTPYTTTSPLAMEFLEVPALEKRQSQIRKLLIDYNKGLLK
jgi:para-nitrobenzyl esterase